MSDSQLHSGKFSQEFFLAASTLCEGLYTDKADGIRLTFSELLEVRCSGDPRTPKRSTAEILVRVRKEEGDWIANQGTQFSKRFGRTLAKW